MRLVICSSLAITRECFRARLQAEGDVEVVGETPTCAGAFEVVRDLRPDVLLVDADTPGFEATGLVRAVVDATPSTRVVVLACKDDPRAGALLELGVAGFLSEEASVADLLAALRTPPGGLTAIDPAAARVLRADAAAWDQPMARQLQVLLRVAEGATNRMIADAIGIAERTVEFHLSRPFVKLGAASRAEAVTRARQRGWLD